jgi:hypothetical protein
MNAKFILKVSILVFGLVMVIFASKYFSSQPFQNNLDEAFKTGSQFQWCSTKFEWLNADMAAKTKSQDPVQVTKKYCLVYMESIQGIDLKTATWQQLAEGRDSDGQSVYLEWDKALQIFRAAGLPFKSSVLSRDLAN